MARVLFLLADDFEDVEWRQPWGGLADAGHELTLAGLEAGTRVDGKRGEEHPEIEVAVADVDGGEFDALVLPGGYSPDHLRMDGDAVDIVRSMVDAGKPVAAVCHAPWLLAEAAVLSGRTVTSWPSIRTDLRNAGADVVDQEVCVDDNLITSRNPDDLPAFVEAIRAAIA